MPSGILLIDKPAGVTSFGVVARVRRVLSDRHRQAELRQGTPPAQIPKKIKVGHAGTLDPFATGLLILLVGTATKQAGRFLKLDKTYEATLRLGAVSATGDPEGEITASVDAPLPTRAEIVAVLPRFTGRIRQKVPAFSAVKIRGERAYKLARKGRAPDTPVRTVEVYSLEILGYSQPELKIRCAVSSGTYIRALGEDLGRELGCGAYLTELRRTRVGGFDVSKAISLNDFMAHPERARILDCP